MRVWVYLALEVAVDSAEDLAGLLVLKRRLHRARCTEAAAVISNTTQVLSCSGSSLQHCNLLWVLLECGDVLGCKAQLQLPMLLPAAVHCCSPAAVCCPHRCEVHEPAQPVLPLSEQGPAQHRLQLVGLALLQQLCRESSYGQTHRRCLAHVRP